MGKLVTDEMMRRDDEVKAVLVCVLVTIMTNFREAIVDVRVFVSFLGTVVIIFHCQCSRLFPFAPFLFSTNKLRLSFHNATKARKHLKRFNTGDFVQFTQYDDDFKFRSKENTHTPHTKHEMTKDR